MSSMELPVYGATSADIVRMVEQAAATNQLPAYVAVEGPIGVGKTTLAKRLAQSFGYQVMLEPVTENPFLDRFYAEGNQHALPTQLFFLLHRARQIADISNEDLLERKLVADFLIEKDRLFAQLTLDEQEFDLYSQIQDSLRLAPPKPDLVIYLQAPAEVLQARIHGRGIDFEQDIETDYLSALASAYTEFFHYYSDAPLLIVNAADIDFAHNDVHFELLLQQVIQMDGTRQFFNPHPTLI